MGASFGLKARLMQKIVVVLSDVVADLLMRDLMTDLWLQ